MFLILNRHKKKAEIQTKCISALIYFRENDKGSLAFNFSLGMRNLF
ncbi:hypothetical protein KAOT1_13467 [Kordia algicida OT-1]|uniref:Uncharacterized protein n=1 Tax=Kordia algicida OT-1 TaxID=391587 RepID=A9DK00_9FLAO|nr:hypothetical protein KAOT1_13467 [Kordia algicida OT-1]